MGPAQWVSRRRTGSRRALIPPTGSCRSCSTPCGGAGWGAAGSFLVTLDDLLRQDVEAGGEAWAWHGAISALREQMPRQNSLPLLAGDSQRLQHAEGLWHQARVLIGEYAWRTQADDNRRARQQSDQLHDITRALAFAGDVPELMDILAAELPALGIGSCVVALYENPPAGEGGCAGACLALPVGAGLRRKRARHIAAGRRNLACPSSGIGRAVRRCSSSGSGESVP